MAIASFADAATEDIFNGRNTKAGRAIPKDLWPLVRRKLFVLHYANGIDDLRVPPGNRLERLRGDLAGRWSIRINDQFRLVFRYENATALDVVATDYH